MDTIVVIPALNPDERLRTLVKELRALGLRHIVIVNDGSGPACGPLFKELSALGCEVLRHPHNQGKGAALKTAFRHVMETRPDCAGGADCRASFSCPGCVTADADLQHSPADILRVARAMEEHPDSLVLGTRRFRGDTASAPVPFRSRWGNRITSAVFYRETGVRCADTQTGLRGIPHLYLAGFAAIPGERFEYEMNVLLEAAKKDIPLLPVPIETIYSEGKHVSHFHTVRDSLRVYAGFLRFSVSSLASAAIDLLLFALLSALVFPASAAGIMAATLIARVCSGVCNFLINRSWVFGERRTNGIASSAKYAALFCVKLLLSGWLVGLVANLPIPLTLSKMIVDTALFFVSYLIQRGLVFRDARAGAQATGGVRRP